MKTITIGFSRAKSDWLIGSKIIQLVEKRPYSHCIIIYKDPILNKDMVFQASHGMVNHISYFNFSDINLTIKTYELEFNDNEFNTFYEFMFNKLGIPYGRLELIGIGIKKLFHLESPFHDGLQTEICSELAARVCKLKGIEIPINLDEITPSDLDTILGGLYGKT